jgi:hypothetical protein
MGGLQRRVLRSLILGGTLITGFAGAMCMKAPHIVWELDVLGCAHVREAVVEGWERRGLAPQAGRIARVVGESEFVVVSAQVVRSRQLWHEYEADDRPGRWVADEWREPEGNDVREFLVRQSGDQLCDGVRLGRQMLLQPSVCDDTPAVDVRFVTGLPVLQDLAGAHRVALETAGR